MIIEIDTDVFYDSEKTWYQQSPECIEMGQALILTPPFDSETEACLGGASRLLGGVWHTTTATGSFAMRVERTYVYPPENPAFLSKEFQDNVTVTVL